jgi:hypothetical protein
MDRHGASARTPVISTRLALGQRSPRGQTDRGRETSSSEILVVEPDRWEDPATLRIDILDM